MSDEKPESGPLVITFRSHHNAYKDGDGSKAKIIAHPKPTGILYKVFQILYGLFIIHYFLWFIPMLLLLWIPYHLGYPIISVALLAMYLPTYFNKDELKLGRPWEWFRQHWTWKMLQHYGDLEIVREVELDPKRKYIFGYHPHGILILSRIGTYAGIFEMLFPGTDNRCLGATPMFNHPGSREICLWMGAVRADKSIAIRILENNINLLLYPGGSDEIFLTDPESPETVIIARKGFIKLALQQGCDLIPCFVFGEKHAYHKLDIPEAIKSFFMKNLRTPLIIFWGRFFTWLPISGDKSFLSIVYGQPIKIEKVVPDPSDEEIDEIYTRFYDGIRGLFEKYKGKYGYAESDKLVIREVKSSSKTKAQINGYSKSASDGNGHFVNGLKSEYGNGVQNGQQH